MARAGMSDEEMTTFLKETFCVDSARTVWDFHRTTLASGVWRTYLPTPSVPSRRTRPHLPTYPPRLFVRCGPTCTNTMKKHIKKKLALLYVSWHDLTDSVS